MLQLVPTDRGPTAITNYVPAGHVDNPPRFPEPKLAYSEKYASIGPADVSTCTVRLWQRCHTLFCKQSLLKAGQLGVYLLLPNSVETLFV